MIYLILLLQLTLTKAQTPISLPPNQVFNTPVNIPFPESASFEKQTFILSIIPPTNVLVELYISSSPPHSASHAPLLSASELFPPKEPSTTTPCSQTQPCAPEPFDKIAFYTRADTASISIASVSSTVYITVYNWKLPGLPHRALNASLYTRTTNKTTGVCAGTARGNVCRGRGRCAVEIGECVCLRGWGGRSCGTRLEKAPLISEQPLWDGLITAMKDSAVVRVGTEGVSYVWDIRGGGSGVEFRARVLKGDIIVDGARVQVDGGGGRFGMVVKRGYENLGKGLENGTRLGTVYDTAGVGRVLTGVDGVYEVVVVGMGTGNWVMSLFVDGGEAVVSVGGRRCGGVGLLECSINNGRGGVGVGLGIAAAAVGGLVLVVLSVLYVCWSMKINSV